jgi:hypothetical protein
MALSPSVNTGIIDQFSHPEKSKRKKQKKVTKKSKDSHEWH